MTVLTQQQALTIVARYTPDLDDTARTALLAEVATTRTIGGVVTLLHDPYAATLLDLYHPDRVKSRSEGSVSETYVDVKDTAQFLRDQSARLQASWPVGDTLASMYNTDLELVGWLKTGK